MDRDNLPATPAGGGNNLPVQNRFGPDGIDRRMPVQAESHSVLTTSVDGSNQDSDDEIDLLAYWRMLVKRRWLIAGIVVVVVAIALVRTLLTPPTFRATVTMQIDTESVQVMQVQGITPMGGWDPDFNQTQYELLQSRSLAERVAEDLNLANSNIFEQLTPPTWSQRLGELLNPDSRVKELPLGPKEPEAAGDTNADDGSSAPDKNAAGDALKRLRWATGLVQGGISVDPIRDSHLVRVSYDSMLPAFSARVANAVADGFIASSMDRQFGASSYAKKYLEDQLAQLKSRLETSERSLVAFAQKENIVPSADGTSLVGQNLADLNASKAKAQEQRIRAEARWQEASKVSGAALPADMLTDSILRTLQQQRAQLQGQYQQKLQTFKPEYPEMLSLKSQIDEVSKQIDNELKNIRASVKAEYDAAVSQETMLEAQLDSLRTQTLEADGRSIQYNILKRDVDTNRQLYNALLQRYKEVGMAGGAKPSNISIIDRAQVPMSRFAPNLSRNLMLGFLLGVMLGVMIALLLEYIDDSLKSPQDIENHLKLPVLGIIPKLTKLTPREALNDPRSAFSESYRSVRTALQFSTDSGVPKVLLITSPAASEGKSTSALTLAQNFVQLGKRVLLIEGDLRNPSLAKVTGLIATDGLSSLLSGAKTFDQAVTKSDNKNLDVILSGPLPPSPTELLAGSRLVSLLLIAAQKYDQIIIDGPPVLGIADAPILANAAGGTLMIIRSGTSKITSAQAAIKRLRVTRARLIGVLLTQYDAKASGYGYEYEGYYAYGGSQKLLDGKAR
ncbi:MAG TPA: polysaccharide biosynthesis tyrosine autokinase [Dokdonella sp.]|uniref:GumC family protein n=1 Tax=Dokdonella sp. TaxID=2291710 RepID=UPI002D7EEBAC|nr:polysaccharide biosynthesis tyrosine autokinase [Dokdonella sp.]HET9033541.1 polysaccharide biosynthesis tyrosine autokinase [Dokdonella sp.]